MRMCFVAMPSGRHHEYGHGEDEAQFVFSHIIKPAVDDVLSDTTVDFISPRETSGLPANATHIDHAPDFAHTGDLQTVFADREFDNLEPGAISAKIIKKLNQYDYAVVDITGGNPNVFYELGVRHALKKKVTIIMRQTSYDIPFDIGNYRVIDYTPFKFEEARNKLKNALKAASTNEHHNDILVVDALGDYDVIFRSGQTLETMSWDYYFQAIRRLSAILRTAHKQSDPEKKYSPDAVLGISNGGMIFADSLYLEKIYGRSECRFFSLWANRDRRGKFFDSEDNRGLIHGIVADCKKPTNEIRLLIVDDNVAGGDTSGQAFDFIKSVDGNLHARFLPLFFNRKEILENLETTILWRHKAFIDDFKAADILAMHYINYRYFPYGKAISK